MLSNFIHPKQIISSMWWRGRRFNIPLLLLLLPLSPLLSILLSTSVLIPSYCLVSDDIPHKADQCWHSLRYDRERVRLTVITPQVTAKCPCDVTVFSQSSEPSKQLAVLMAYLNYNKGNLTSECVCGKVVPKSGT